MLLLFDIDGTLLRSAAGAHREALREALVTVHGVHAALGGGSLSVAGRTDGEIARIALVQAGISAERIDERTDDVREASSQAFARLCPPDLSAFVVPGMPALLEWVSEQSGYAPALLTGNYEAIARLKLRRAGIGRFFPAGQGAFGSDDEDRAGLPPIARRRAGSPGRPYPRDQTVVIGDTPRDIACARADGVRCIAVTTGPYGEDELSDADAVAGDTVALREALANL